ncbi:MAG: helix-turn-helix transcriptional regulator [Limisphaerales bacterium]
MSKGFDVEAYLRDSFGVFTGEPEGDYEVVVDLDAWAADETRGRKWHQSQEVTELPKGMLRLRMRLNNLEEVERWLLSFGTHATVVRPYALRERLAKVGREYLRRYAESEA